MKSFLLEIVTPEKITFSDQVEMVTVPGSDGVLGILPHHVPLMTNLVHGELKMLKDGRETYLSIGGGFLEVTKEKVTILVTRAVKEDELNEKAILEAKRKAEEALSKKPTGAELANATALLRSSLTDLKILDRRLHRRPRTNITKS